jgi:hypothetical protein
MVSRNGLLSNYVEQQQKYAHITCTTLEHHDFIRPPAVYEKTFSASFVLQPAENSTSHTPLGASAASAATIQRIELIYSVYASIIFVI